MYYFSFKTEMSNNENPKFLEVPQQSLLNGEVYENFNKKLEREYGEGIVFYIF